MAKKPTKKKTDSGRGSASRTSTKAKSKSKPAASASKPAPAPAKLTPKLIEKAKSVLEAERRKLSARIGSIDDDNESNVGDIADAATHQEARAVIEGIQATERDQLQQVEDALEKIAAGRYGLCERCDKPIESARLEAIPHVRTCISCKRKEEIGGAGSSSRAV